MKYFFKVIDKIYCHSCETRIKYIESMNKGQIPISLWDIICSTCGKSNQINEKSAILLDEKGCKKMTVGLFYHGN